MAFEQCWEIFEPAPDEPMLLWLLQHFKTPDERPYDHFASPHIGAPGGPWEAMQDPHVREVILMWASRLGKTYSGLAFLLWISAVWPAPCFFASATRDLVEQIIGERAWKIVELAGLWKVPPEGRRPKRTIRLPKNRWHSGWSESPRTLADKAAKVLHGNEIGKWRHLRGTNEAHPWQLAKERPKEFPDRKIIGEGTPTVQGRCTVETDFLAGWQCRLAVPCPKCVRWQFLRFGKGDKGGIVAEGLHGRADPSLAQRTARYACAYCGTEWGNEVRPWVMRRGLWVPDGAEIDQDEAAKIFDGLPEFSTHHEHPSRPYRWEGWDNAKWIRGTLTRPGEIASYQLSTLYSLAVGWGDVARKFAEAKQKPALLQNFINSWLGETFRQQRREEEWEKVARRLMGEHPTPRYVVPREFSRLAIGVDVQADHYVYGVVAVGRPRRWAVVDEGEADSLDEILEKVALRPYDHADGGAPVYPCRMLVDTGYDPASESGETIHHWARQATKKAARVGRRLIVRGCKGASKQLGMPFDERILGARSAAPGSRFVLVDGDFTQSIIEHALYEATPGAEGSLALFEAEVHDHEDFVRQLMNESRSERLTSGNRIAYSWDRVDETFPNDDRDKVRYAIVALLQEIRGREAPPRSAAAAQVTQEEPRRRSPTAGGGFVSKPDGGRPFVTFERK